MTSPEPSGQAPTEESAGGLLDEILQNDWHQPVLAVLADGPKRYTQLKAGLLGGRATAPDRAPGDGRSPEAPPAGAGGALLGAGPSEGQITATLRDLLRLGLVKKSDGSRGPWTLTASGHSVVDDLVKLAVLMAADPARGKGWSTSMRPLESAWSRGELMRGNAALKPGQVHPARRYNYWLGGKDNFAADRASGDELEKLYPGGRAGVRANRDVLGRTVRYLAGECGIRQYLDIGTGLPTEENTHQVAQAIVPASRILYVDNDPMVLSHARSLLTSSSAGTTEYLDADLHDPDSILNSAAFRETFDLQEPVALLLVSVLHFIEGHGAAKPIVDRLMGRLPPGSYLVVTHVTNDFQSAAVIAAHEAKRQEGRSDFWMRTKEEIVELFDGLELLAPGVVPLTKWRPDPDAPDVPLKFINAFAGVARKGTDAAG